MQPVGAAASVVQVADINKGMFIHHGSQFSKTPGPTGIPNRAMKHLPQ